MGVAYANINWDTKEKKVDTRHQEELNKELKNILHSDEEPSYRRMERERLWLESKAKESHNRLTKLRELYKVKENQAAEFSTSADLQTEFLGRCGVNTSNMSKSEIKQDSERKTIAVMKKHFDEKMSLVEQGMSPAQIKDQQKYKIVLLQDLNKKREMEIERYRGTSKIAFANSENAHAYYNGRAEEYDLLVMVDKQSGRQITPPIRLKEVADQFDLTVKRDAMETGRLSMSATLIADEIYNYTHGEHDKLNARYIGENAIEKDNNKLALSTATAIYAYEHKLEELETKLEKQHHEKKPHHKKYYIDERGYKMTADQLSLREEAIREEVTAKENDYKSFVLDQKLHGDALADRNLNGYDGGVSMSEVYVGQDKYEPDYINDKDRDWIPDDIERQNEIAEQEAAQSRDDDDEEMMHEFGSSYWSD